MAVLDFLNQQYIAAKTGAHGMWPFNTRQTHPQPELPQSKPARKNRTHNSTSEFKSEARSLTGLPTRILGKIGRAHV